MTGIETANAWVIDEFLSGKQQAHLKALATGYRRDGVLEANPSGPLRFRRKIYNSEYCDQQVQQVAADIVQRLELTNCPVDPYLGWIISYIEPGGCIKPHIDRHQHYQETSDKHLRCNVLVQGRDQSAYPLIGAQKIEVHERGLWAFFASQHVHGMQELRGNLPRIVFQFGFSVPAGFALPVKGRS